MPKKCNLHVECEVPDDFNENDLDMGALLAALNGALNDDESAPDWPDALTPTQVKSLQQQTGSKRN